MPESKTGLEDLVFTCELQYAAAWILHDAYTQGRFETCFSRHGTKTRAFLISRRSSTPYIFRLSRGEMQNGEFLMRHTHFWYDNVKMIEYSEEVDTNTKVHMVLDIVRFKDLIQTYIKTLFDNAPTYWLTPQTLERDTDSTLYD